MRVGVCLFAQNSDDWDRFEAEEAGQSVPDRPARSDAEIFAEDIGFHDRVEELGFDSLWTIEHHFTPYTMVNNPVQTLTYFAGRTSRIDLGTMVIVLPWHNPIRVAEDITTLQALMGDDRDAMIGLGRGLGRREFGGLGVEQDEARGRFEEGVRLIQEALKGDRFSFSGEYFETPPTSLRPIPKDGQRIIDNLRGAWGSPESVKVVAGAGLKPILVPQRPWEDYAKEVETFSSIREGLGLEPARPVVLVAAYCAETEEQARAGAERHIGGYGESALRHYEIGGEHFKKLSTYEYYAQQAEEMSKGTVEPNTGMKRAESHIWGTPEMCLEKIRWIQDLVNPSEIVCAFKYASMPLEEAQRSIELFSSQVLPEVHELAVA
jgi:alkanesulfonate monooxygenase SsuD/methylene tetrahydromethanopterin reductase-like flavin-dependent oxidoreductase (luciferase family)